MNEFYDDSHVDGTDDIAVQDHFMLEHTGITHRGTNNMRQIEIMREHKLLLSSIKDVYDL